MFSSGESSRVILATASYDHDIKFWEAHTGVCEKTVKHPESQVNAMAVTTDRQFLAAAGHQHIRIYDINSSDAKHSASSIERLNKNVTSVGYHEDGKWIYGGSEDGTVKIWDCRDLRARNYTEARSMQIDAPCTTTTLHPNQSEIFIGDQNGFIHIWDLVRGDQIPRKSWCPEPGATIQHIAIDSKGHYLAAINNKGKVYVYTINKSSDSGTSISLKKSWEAHEKYSLKVHFSQDSTLLLTTSADSSIKVWNVNDDFSLHSLLRGDPTHRWIWDAVFTNDAQHIISGSSDGVARLWSLCSGKVVCCFSGHQKAITAIAFMDKTRMN